MGKAIIGRGCGRRLVETDLDGRAAERPYAPRVVA